MIFARFRRKSRSESIDLLYDAIVAQARLPVFYSDYRVPDTIDGRLDMIMLHTVLLLNRVSRGDEALRALGQAVFDRFCADMDDNLREMGIGDFAVPKTMQRIAGAFYGRAKTYEAVLGGDDSAALVEALRRNIYVGRSDAEQAAQQLSRYALDAVRQLRDCTVEALLAGQLSFPVPPRQCGGADELKSPS